MPHATHRGCCCHSLSICTTSSRAHVCCATFVIAFWGHPNPDLETRNLVETQNLCAAGPLPIDQELYSQLLATGQFEQMNLDVDEVGVTCLVVTRLISNNLTLSATTHCQAVLGVTRGAQH